MIDWEPQTLIGAGIGLGIGCILIALVLVIRYAINRNGKKVENNVNVNNIAVTEIISETKKEDMDESELIAVLTAAVASCLNTSTYNLNIKSYRKLGSSNSVWNNVSRIENIDGGF